MKRTLVLVDLVSSNRSKVYRTQEYPKLQALARGHGFEVYWLCLGVDGQAQAARENPFVFDLAAPDLEQLCSRISEVKPTHLLINERLEEACWRAVCQAAAGARAQGVAERQLQWLGITDPPGGPSPLQEVEPDHSRELLNPLAQEIRPYTWLMVGPLCLYRRPLRHNPRFEGVDLSACKNPDACSFCLPVRDILPPADPVAEAMVQINAAERTTPAPCRSREYMVSGAALWFRVGAFADALLASELPPSAFFFHCRVDELLRGAAELEARLPDLEARGHSINFHSIGVENFSPAENERFNKQISPAQVQQASELMGRWERRWPGAFSFTRHGGFSFILFTPWTTLADLETNVQGLRRLRSMDQDVVFALRTRLQLLPDRAITALAHHDGLVGAADDDHLFDSGCITDWDMAEIPWRFKDGRVALIYRFSRRLARDPAVPRDDPEAARVRAWVKARERSEERDPLELVSRAVDLLGSSAGAGVETMEDLLLGLTGAPGTGGHSPLSVDLGERGVQLCVRGPCNLGCLFCNLFQDIPEVDEAAHERALAAEVDRLAAAGVRSASWGLYHHEPTTFSGLPRLLARARQGGIQHNILISNGVRTADETYCRELRDAGMDSMVVTMVEYDAPSADVLCQGEGLMAARRRTLENCARLGIKVFPVLTLMRVNYQRVGQALDLYGDLVRDHTLQLVSPTMEERVSWFLPPLSGVVEAVTEAARQRPEFQLTLVDIPRCIQRLHGEDLPNLAHRREKPGRVYPEPCDACQDRQTCGGFSRAYLELYGPDEARGGDPLHAPLTLDELRARSERYIRKNRRYSSGVGSYPPSSRKLHGILNEILLRRRLPELEVTEVDLNHHERVSVRALYMGEEIHVLVSWKDRTDKALVTAGPFALMAPREAPLDSTGKRRAVKALVRALVSGWRRGPA